MASPIDGTLIIHETELKKAVTIFCVFKKKSMCVLYTRHIAQKPLLNEQINLFFFRLPYSILETPLSR